MFISAQHGTAAHMNDWLIVILGGAAASLLAGLVHRLINRPESSRGAQRTPPVDSPTVVEVRPGLTDLASGRTRAEELRVEIAHTNQAIVAGRKRRLIDQMTGWLAVVMACMLPFVVGRSTELSEALAATAVFGIAAALSALVWWIGMRKVRRLKRRVKALQHALDGELGLDVTP